MGDPGKEAQEVSKQIIPLAVREKAVVPTIMLDGIEPQDSCRKQDRT
jgi:hypothetical protein